MQDKLLAEVTAYGTLPSRPFLRARLLVGAFRASLTMEERYAVEMAISDDGFADFVVAQGRSEHEGIVDWLREIDWVSLIALIVKLLPLFLARPH